MNNQSLLDFRHDTFSQNGEDGIIQKIFSFIGSESKNCCEFGAWDGILHSNCRQLILSGWRGLLVESDADKYASLKGTYRECKRVCCVNRFVDTQQNRISDICRQCGFDKLDFLSIDIDGLDYEIFKDLDIFPRVVCIEINAGHSPEGFKEIMNSRAKNNVGQPLPLFSRIAHEKGYSLACYTGNAFYVKNSDFLRSGLVALSDEDAYLDFLRHLPPAARDWLYLVNLGLVNPHYRFRNRYLRRRVLGIGAGHALRLAGMRVMQKLQTLVYRFAKKCIGIVLKNT